MSLFTLVYNALGRLIEVKQNGTTTEAYNYDNNGNRLTATLNGQISTGSYNDDDQLISYGENNYQYDADGYLSQKTTPTSTTQYSYGTLGELRRVAITENGNPPKNIDYQHDANNQRVAKLINGEITEKYLWADLTTLLAVYDKDDNLLQRFDYAGQRMPVSMETPTGKYYLHYNQVGSLRAVSNSSHQIEKKVSYDSFGNIQNDSNPSLSIPFGFAGGLYDTDTQLTRFGYRDYDAQTGRWTAKDPIDFAGGDSNLYGYVFSDPVNLVDPRGEFAGALVLGGTVIVTIGACYVTGLCEKIGNALRDTLNAWWNLPKPSDFVLSPPWVNNESDDSSGESCPTPETHPDEFDKLRGDQGHRPKDKKKKNERWKKDKLHGDHWDVSNKKGKKIKEIDFGGKQIWPDGPKNKNKR